MVLRLHRRIREPPTTKCKFSRVRRCVRVAYAQLCQRENQSKLERHRGTSRRACEFARVREPRIASPLGTASRDHEAVSRAIELRFCVSLPRMSPDFRNNVTYTTTSATSPRGSKEEALLSPSDSCF